MATADVEHGANRDRVPTQKTHDRRRIAQPPMRAVQLPVSPCYHVLWQTRIVEKLSIETTAQAPDFSQPWKTWSGTPRSDARQAGLEWPYRDRPALRGPHSQDFDFDPRFEPVYTGGPGFGSRVFSPERGGISHSLRAPGHIYAHRHFVLHRYGQKRRRVNLEIR
jgi:hypothetical protein